MKALNIFFKRNLLEVTLLIIYIIFLCNYQLNLEENDDLVMMFLSEENFKRGNYYLVFISSLISPLINFIKTINPDLIGYYIVLLFFQIISFAGLFFLNNEVNKSKKNKLYWINLLLIVSLLIYLTFFFQFTRISGILFITGLLINLYSKHRYKNIFSFFFLFSSSLIRFNMFLLLIVFSIFFLLIIRYLNFKKIKFDYVLIFALLFSFSVNYLEKQNLEPEFSQYAELNSMRGYLNDNRRVWQIEDHKGLELDVYFVRYFFLDPNYYSKEVYEKINQLLPNDIEQLFKNFIATNKTNKLLGGIFFCSLFFFFILNPKNWSNLILIATVFIVYEILLFYLSLSSIFRERVAFFVVFLMMFFLYYNSAKRISPKYLLIFPVLLFLLGFKFDNNSIKKDDAFTFLENTDIKHLKLFTITGISFIDLNPKEFLDFKDENNIVFHGWVMQHPYAMEDYSSHVSLDEDFAFFYNKKYPPELPENLVKFIESKYDKDYCVEILNESSEFIIFKLNNIENSQQKKI